MKLTVKQQKFADNFVKTGNGKQSAIDAGYSPRTAKQMATENLSKPYLKAYIDSKLKEIEDAKIMDAKEALELLTSIARGDMTETVFVPTINGDVIEEEKTADFKTKIAAIREILKRYPGSDKLRDAQARKLVAEADLAELRVKNVTDGDDEQMTVLTNLMGKLSGEVKGVTDDESKRTDDTEAGSSTGPGTE